MCHGYHAMAMGKRWWMSSQRGWSSIHERWYGMLVEQEDSPSPSHHHLLKAGIQTIQPWMFLLLLDYVALLYIHMKNSNVTKGVMTVPRIPCWNPGSFGGLSMDTLIPVPGCWTPRTVNRPIWLAEKKKSGGHFPDFHWFRHIQTNPIMYMELLWVYELLVNGVHFFNNL